ncbi:MAG TPA: UbiA family prenyltransferase [Candidatus Dormibacteraeota bacterium]|nr:UbiA family prenyltransferase [Candidatus Dormibacteraeota bacterium]
MFAIIFFWTPPHFWALALVLSRQHSAGKVPMLPVVAGEERTRRSIFFYSVVLLAVSLVPVIWLGSIYAVASITLGLVFLAFAARASRRKDGASAIALFSLLARLLGPSLRVRRNRLRLEARVHGHATRPTGTLLRLAPIN